MLTLQCILNAKKKFGIFKKSHEIIDAESVQILSRNSNNLKNLRGEIAWEVSERDCRNRSRNRGRRSSSIGEISSRRRIVFEAKAKYFMTRRVFSGIRFIEPLIERLRKMRTGNRAVYIAASAFLLCASPEIPNVMGVEATKRQLICRENVANARLQTQIFP